jgi:hypothetical protein
MHLFLSISDFLRSHRAWGKEHTQIEKSRNPANKELQTEIKPK